MTTNTDKLKKLAEGMAWREIESAPRDGTVIKLKLSNDKYSAVADVMERLKKRLKNGYSTNSFFAGTYGPGLTETLPVTSGASTFSPVKSGFLPLCSPSLAKNKLGMGG